MNEKRVNFMTDKTTYNQFKEFCKKNNMTVSKCLRRLIIWAPIFLTSPEWKIFKAKLTKDTNGKIQLWDFE